MLTIMGRISEIADSFKSFIIKNQLNPLLWMGLFFGGLLLFSYTYRKLNK